MIKPWDLKNMLQRAKDTLERNEVDTAFALAWILWEGFRFRILVIEAYRKGWSMKDARQALGKAFRIVNGDFKEAYRRIVGKRLHDTMPPPHRNRWSTIVEIAETRHRFFHGYGTPSGDHVRLQTEFLLNFIDSWEAAIAKS